MADEATKTDTVIDPMTELAAKQAELEKKIGDMAELLKQANETNAALLKTNAQLVQASAAKQAEAVPVPAPAVSEKEVQDLAFAALKRELGIKE